MSAAPTSSFLLYTRNCPAPIQKERTIFFQFLWQLNSFSGSDSIGLLRVASSGILKKPSSIYSKEPSILKKPSTTCFKEPSILKKPSTIFGAADNSGLLAPVNGIVRPSVASSVRFPASEVDHHDRGTFLERRLTSPNLPPEEDEEEEERDRKNAQKPVSDPRSL